MSNVDLDKVAASFLAIVQPNRLEKSKRALEVLLPAYERGEIYNVDFKDYKAILDRSFEEAWNALTQKDATTYWLDPNDFKKGLSIRGQIDDEIYTYVSGVRSALALSKKIAKAAKKFKDPYLDTLRTFVDAALPLANVLEVLKTKTISGRKPLPPEKQAAKAAQLAKKDMKTCACCFRSIARYPNGLIADHGYSLPSIGFKTISCPGRQFKPLEVSSDGLKYMIDYLEGRAKQLKSAIKSFPEKTTLRIQSYSKKPGQEITKDDVRWSSTYKSQLGKLESDLRYTEQELREFQARLRTWKPTIEEGIGQLAGQLRAHLEK